MGLKYKDCNEERTRRQLEQQSKPKGKVGRPRKY